jgi:vancomycin resistance protein YoaR
MGKTLSVQGSTTAAPARRRRTEAKARARARTSRTRLLLACAAGVAVFVLGVGLGFAGSGDRIAAGVTIGGVDVGGLTAGQAKAALAQRAAHDAGTAVTFTAGGRTWRIAPRELGIAGNWSAAVDEAIAKGAGWSLVRGFRRIALRLSPQDVTPSVHAYSNAVAYKVSLLADDVDRPHRDARLVRHGLSFQLVGGQAGRKLDQGAARRLVVAALADPTPGRVQLPVQTDPPRVTVAQLVPVRARAMRVVSDPVTLRIGIANFVVEPKRLAAMLRLPSGGSAELGFGGPAANAYFRKLDHDVSSPAKDAGFVVNGSSISVSPAKAGVALDVPKTAARMLAAAERSDPRVAPIAVGTSQPARTTADAKAMGINGLVGSYETIYGGIANRIHNVQLVARLIDGKLIAPGATFSFNGATGERTAEKGFLEAPVIINGELETGLGGGVCQVSTTVFNAAYEAGLPITSRTNHALYISHYPLGRDATVDYPNVDLKFVNDTGKWLLLRTFVGSSSLVVNLYGTPQNRRVETETAPLRVISPAPVERQLDPAVAPGEQVVQQYGVPAQSTSVNRKVYSASGKLLYDSTWVSNYEAEPEIILYGPAKKAPKPKTKAKAKPKATGDASTGADTTVTPTAPQPPQ